MHPIKMYILDNGWVEYDESLLVSNPTLDTISNHNPYRKWIKSPCYCVLIDHPEKGWMLFDTGSHPEAMKGYWPNETIKQFPYYRTEQQLLINQLALIGLKPQDIKTVILSHGHLDHAGGLFLFKNADIYWPKADYEYAKRLLAIQPESRSSGPYIRADIESPARELHFVTKNLKLAPGIEIITLRGHTPEVLGLVVHLNSCTYIFPSDGIYMAPNYGSRINQSDIFYDNLSCLESIEKVRKLNEKSHSRIMYSHDMEQFKRFKLAPEYYE